MITFSTIIILYNPTSTGPSGDNAKAFAKELRAELPKTTTVRVRATKYAGHAEEIAASYGQSDQSTLIISSSGDGGYHEIVNGVLSSGSTHVATGLLPSGNANDHYNAVHKDEVIERIRHHQVTTIDVLKVQATVDDKPWQRYAHSYVGIGLSPQVGQKLTEARLNPFNQVWIAVSHLFRFHPAKIMVDGHTHRYDSLIFSNIDRMSKVLSLGDDVSVSDGKFEITAKRTTSPTQLLAYLLKASTVGLDGNRHHQRFRFTCLQPLSIQLDGEVYKFTAGTVVTITSCPRILPCVI